MTPLRVALCLAAVTLAACGGDDGPDSCPDNPDKTEPGECGCNVLDTDSDGDGTPDCLDRCAADPQKTALGLCGCGVADTDSDNDSRPDCYDGCPEDKAKVIPGPCGCGVSDSDFDADGLADCVDGCPADPSKTEPGQCGCGVTEGLEDTDADGTLDCIDGCDEDPLKTEEGICGCGHPDSEGDPDGDGVVGCDDNCPTVANPIVDVTVTETSPIVTNPFGGTGHVCDDGSACYGTCDVSTNGSAPEHGICQALGYEYAISVSWGGGLGEADTVMPHAYNWACVDFVCGASTNTYQSDNCSSSEMLSTITCHSYGQPDSDHDGLGDACDP